MSLATALTLAQAKILLERLASEPLLDSPTAKELVANIGQDDWSAVRALFSTATVEIIMEMPEEAKVAVANAMALMSERIEASVARKAQGVALLRAGAATLRQGRERERAEEAEAALLSTERAGSVAVDVAEQLKRIASEVREPSPPGLPVVHPAVAPASPVPTSPSRANEQLLSELEQGFFRAKRFKPGELSQKAWTFQLWREIVGDRVPSEYIRQDVIAFQAGLRDLPNSHGKSAPKNALNVIEKTRGLDVDRISEKTIARHFSLLRQMWEHLGKEAANPNIWDDFEHQIEENHRVNWSTENLDILLRGRWNLTGRAGNRIAEETHAWLVAIGAYSGCRIEEIARIKSAGVVRDDDGVLCFHVDKEILVRPGRRVCVAATVKTPSSVRRVPIHPKLEEAGIERLARDRMAFGEEYLLALTPSGKGGKRGAEYSRIFSKHKQDLGIGPENVLHSFRHSVETILGSKDVKQQWVDAFLGHASERPGDKKKSVGEKVYLHGIQLDCVAAAAYQVAYPPEIEPTLLLRRVRGQVPW